MLTTRSDFSIAERLRIKGQVKLPAIIGGIGPLSHTEFERLLLQVNSSTRGDQDHPGYLLINATSFPDRTRALKEEKQGNLALSLQVEEGIINYSRWACKQGCDFIVFICNTIHNWYPRVEERLSIPWVHITHIKPQGFYIALFKCH